LLPEYARTPEMRASAERAGARIDANQFVFRLSSVPLASLRSDDIAEWKKRNEEHRAAMGTTSGAVGAYTVPDAAMQALEIALLEFGGMRRVATVIRTDTGGSLPFPTTDDTSNKGAILTENTQVSEVDITFGQLTLDAYMYSSKSVLVSLQLLQDSSVDVPSMIGRLLGERIGRIQNDHFTTGTGSSQPNGIVTASTSGVTGVADPPTYDNFVDLVHSVDPAYRENARFMFSDATLKTLKKIKVLQYSGDTIGIPLWTPGLSAGQQDTILGYQFVVNQSMASPGSSAKKVIFGDLSKYMIRDVRDITLVRLNERYADYHQVGFLAFARSDGDLLDAGTHPVKYMAQA
jgi:HK97 family phage major capsid protein